MDRALRQGVGENVRFSARRCCRLPRISRHRPSPRRFYYHAESQKTAWEAPTGARVQRAASASAGSAAGGLRATDGSTMMLTVLALVVPVLILFGGLLVIYYQASREGLHEMLKNLKQKRDRSTKRKGERPLPAVPRRTHTNRRSPRAGSHCAAGSKAGSKYKTKFKLSQDGKGGRSANS